MKAFEGMETSIIAALMLITIGSPAAKACLGMETVFEHNHDVTGYGRHG